ncbi:unnamed protein product [Linum tenue]|uniref:Cytochrome P450 n=1 Tax=Linum tenue TaxID=586396 RepID=A0AAV0JJ30_9ROSI|nr:unnamed protein product [Linum tenue]
MDDWSLAATTQIALLLKLNLFPPAARLIILALFLVISTTTLLLKRSAKSKQRAGPGRRPPGPRKLPVIGNLHQMVGPSLPHRRLADLAQEYGPLMLMELGEISCLVVSSPEWAKRIMQTHDATFADRSTLPAVDVIFYGGRDIVFAPHGEFWREMKKVSVVELFGAARVRSFRPIREQETGKLVESIRAHTIASSSATSTPVSLGNCITSRAAFGKTGDQKQVEAVLPYIEEIIETLGVFSLVDVFPSSKLLRFITRFDTKLKKLHAAADAIMETIISDHVAKRSSAKHDDDDDEDLVDALLNLKDNNDLGFPFTNVEIKAVILDMFIAGMATWAVLTEWAMSELMKNPKIMEKAQKEVRQVFDKKGQVVNEALLDELHYLQLVIKETLRLHPPGPFTIPRKCRKTTVIDGYEIPVGTRVFINISALGRDPNHWTEPETFNPERFLNNPINYNGLDFNFVPFGSGRRMCPAIQYATTIVSFVLANLLYHFDWKLPNGMRPEDIDLKEKSGLEVRRKNNLLLIPIPYYPN